MTREMKIGLLLSLGIVIVVFVLLSDQVVSTDVRPASMAEAGPLVHEGTVTPGGASAAMAGPIQIDNKVQPEQPLAIVQEMTPRPAPSGVSLVDVGPVQSGTMQVTTANANVPTNSRVTSVEPGTPSTPNTLVADALRTLTPNPSNAVEAPAPRSREYKAVAGDTVAKMARTFYGSDTKANRELIINANKAALKADPSKVVVGKAYVIPAKSSPAPAPVAAAPTTRPAAELAAVPAGAATTLMAAARPEPSPAERFYVVKSGDNLWKIAKEQCKDSNAVDEIKKLNRDQLKGGADLKIGMKLKLPSVM